MGEYAVRKSDGERVKIGTCEDMYYLRADQLHDVRAEENSVDPVQYRDELRFRFPWPEEDDVAPGDFDDCDRSLRLYAVRAPESVDHGNVQFRADNGYLLSLPCPEDASEYDPEGRTLPSADNVLRIGKNGYGGASKLVQQRWWEGRLVPVLACKGCGHAWRLPEIGDASDLLRELHGMAEAKRRDHRLSLQRDGVETLGDLDVANRYDEIAQRILDGYDLAEVPA